MTLTPEQMAEIEKRHRAADDMPCLYNSERWLSLHGLEAHDDRDQLLAHARVLERQLSERRAADREAIARVITETLINMPVGESAGHYCADAIIALQSAPPEGAK